MTVLPIEFPEGTLAKGRRHVIVQPTLDETTLNADPKTITLAALNNAAGLVASCYLYSGGNVTGEQQKGDAPSRVCETETRENLGSVKLSIEDLLYVQDPQGDDDKLENKLATILTPRSKAYVADRLGLTNDVPLAAGQYVNIAYVNLGEQNDTVTGDGEFDEFAITQGASVIRRWRRVLVA